MTSARAEQAASPAEPSDWGIDPVPQDLRHLGTFDTAALWGNLGISLLLPIVAAFLVPGLSFAQALLAIVVGVVVGNLMLAYAGRIGAATGAPGMVLYRPSLGRAARISRRSSISCRTSAGVRSSSSSSGRPPQRSRSARSASAPGRLDARLRRRRHADGRRRTTARRSSVDPAIRRVAGARVDHLSHGLRPHGGPASRRSSTRAATGSLLVLGRRRSRRLDADLVDPARRRLHALLADRERAGFVGTGVGYAIAHAWFYVLGVLLILSNIATRPHDPTASSPRSSPSRPAWSRSRSSRWTKRTKRSRTSTPPPSRAERVPEAEPARAVDRHRRGVHGARGRVPLVQYENFLLLIGAVFVPLFGVLAAHYAVVRRGYTTDDIYGTGRAVRAVGIRRVDRRIPRVQLDQPRHRRVVDVGDEDWVFGLVPPLRHRRGWVRRCSRSRSLPACSGTASGGSAGSPTRAASTRQQLDEHARGRAPHDVARPRRRSTRVPTPSRSRTSSRRRDGIGEHLERRRRRRGRPRSRRGRTRTDAGSRPRRAAPGTRTRTSAGRRAPEHADVCGSRPTSSWASRSAVRSSVLVRGFEAAAREGHLSLVRADVVGALREDDVEHVLPDEQRDEHGCAAGSRPRSATRHRTAGCAQQAEPPRPHVTPAGGSPPVTTPVRPSSRPWTRPAVAPAAPGG